MSVQIHINGENAIEAIKELSDLAANLVVAPVAAATQAEAPQEDKPKRQRSAKQEDPAPKQQEEQQPEQPEQSEQPEPQQQGSSDNVPTVVELRAKAQEVGTSPEAKKAIKALLDQFGAKSISDVPEEKRADFLAELDLI